MGFTDPGGTRTPGRSLNTMTYTLARILSASALGILVTGCATVPGDPYYEPSRYQVYEQPGYIYSAPPPVYQAPPVYRAPGVIYSAPPPPPVYYGGRDRHDDRWDKGRDRDDWRERERDRDRAERDRAARERDQREQQAREADRRARERDQARREQAERDRRAAEDRRNRNHGQLPPGTYMGPQSSMPDKP